MNIDRACEKILSVNIEFWSLNSHLSPLEEKKLYVGFYLAFIYVLNVRLTCGTLI